MPVAEREHTHTAMAPPPLPKYYLSKRERKEVSLSSSSEDTTTTRDILVVKEQAMSFDGAYDTKPYGARLGPPLRTPVMAMPPTHFDPDNIPPLAIYHICRICLRPRSPRYHRQHPIPIDGVPPPPGICRRCRVTTIEDTKTVDVFVESRSNEIKLGMFTPFMKDDAIVSQEEMRQMKLEKYLKGEERERMAREDRDCVAREGSSRERVTSRCRERVTSRSRNRSKADISYRHVLVDAESEGSDPEVESGTARTVFNTWEEVDRAYVEVSPERSRRPRATTSMQVEATERPDSAPATTIKSANMRKLDSMKASVATQVESSKSTSSALASAMVAEYRLQRTDSEIRAIAREEVDRYAKGLQPTERSESEIRRISREEVERYRAAERKLEAHPGPYAHGRLVPVVPVERRIETEQDAPDPVPWSQPAKADVASVKVSAKESSRKPNTARTDSKRETLNVSVSASRKTDRDPEVDRASAKSRSRPVTQEKAISVQGSDLEGKSSGAEEPASQRPGGSTTRSQRTNLEATPSAKASAKNQDDIYSACDVRDFASRKTYSAKLTERDEAAPRSEDESWGPKWRRELSVERRQSVRSEKQDSKASKATRPSAQKSAPSAPAVDSEPPSVKLREESDPPRWSSEAEPYVVKTLRGPQRANPDYIEVIEEIELPPRTRTGSDRRAEGAREGREIVKETKTIYVRGDERERPASPSKRGGESYQASNKPTDRDTRREDATVRTVETRSSKQYQASRKSGVTEQADPQATAIKPNSAMKQPVQEADDTQSAEGSDKTRWPQDQDVRGDTLPRDSRSKSDAPKPRAPLPYPEEDIMPDHDSSAAGPPKKANQQATKVDRGRRPNNSEVEYIYTERIVTPADRPWGWRPPKGKVEVEEEITHHKRKPEGRDSSPR
ncbi:hypothetical protein LTR09_008728 [Extremus antarcticus]|uniref:Uncharacterized protein n=1 Tax=Extremus antarcticus TaxID=702011 RepID=A0AAJ0G646_9PEZI|nr:hypothetical protein LTR09_008728 [Extremus antarcticus]